MSEIKIEERPRFVSLLLSELRDDFDNRGAVALVPFWLIGCLVLSYLISSHVPVAFFSDEKWDISTAVYAGFLAFNGLLLALSWQAFARVQSSICAPGFSSFLKSRSLLGGYLFWIDYVQYSQVMSACLSMLGLITILFDDLLILTDQIILSLVFGFSLYAVKNAVDAAHLMHDVVWLHAEYDQMERDLANSNVAKFPNGSRN
jgi:hypothetical protein